MHNFGEPYRAERIVFGASRPGYPDKLVELSRIKEWLSFVKAKGIRRVCCLLQKTQLDYYKENLLSIYSVEFGQDNLCHAQIKDYHLCDSVILIGKILPFLEESDLLRQKVVVHCSGGSGRTGHVLAGWLIYKHNLSVEIALTAVVESGRDPFEAMKCGNTTIDELYSLLRHCKKYSNTRETEV